MGIRMGIPMRGTLFPALSFSRVRLLKIPLFSKGFEGKSLKVTWQVTFKDFHPSGLGEKQDHYGTIIGASRGAPGEPGGGGGK